MCMHCSAASLQSSPLNCEAVVARERAAPGLTRRGFGAGMLAAGLTLGLRGASRPAGVWKGPSRKDRLEQTI